MPQCGEIVYLKKCYQRKKTIMNDRSYDDILNNGSYCVIPWVHLHLAPSGLSRPCCISSDDFENINDFDSVTDLLNSPKFKNIRQQFLKGEKPSGCDKCYHSEENNRKKNSLRYRHNMMFNSDKIKQSVLKTGDDGTLIDPSIVYFDVRFGNICNLKCRMCGHHYSSTWYDEQKSWTEEQGGTYTTPKFIHVDSYDKIEDFLANAEEIYFAGGEPLLYPEHLRILDKLIETNNTDVRIRYNTNLTSLNYKGKHIPDYWNKFSNVFIGASIDDMGSTVEFIRTNMNWEVFKDNFEYVKKYCPNVRIAPSPTIGFLNAETFVDFIRFIIDNEWTDSWGLLPNFIFHPENLSLKIAPDWYVDYLITLYEKLFDDYKDSSKNESYTNALDLINYIITFLKTNRNAYTEDEKVVLIKSLKNMLGVYNRNPELNWETQLPHIFKFYKEFEK
jgi:MoaA/NifB/PqqE/SkfB family radical SAM enzyme